LQQVASPQVLYDSPVNVFVAGFIGSPSINFFEGQLQRDDGRFIVAVGQHRLALDAIEVARAERLADHVGRSLVLGVRPEHLEDAALAPGTPADRALTGHVRLRESLGSEVVVHFQVEAAPVVSDDLRELAADVDESALLDVHDQERRLRRTAFVGRFGVGTKVSEDAAAQIAIAPGAIRFFDPESGIAL
jgi:multiple sugar transport system ATP-binding protein